jgi:hypothetical protein
VVHAEFGAGLSLESSQQSPAAQATFKHATSMANLKFYELQRLRKSTWDTPRFIRGHDLTVDDRAVLPRGLRHPIEGVVEGPGSRLAVTDMRSSGRGIDVAFAAALTTRQGAAVNAMLTHDDGIRVARVPQPRGGRVRPFGQADRCAVLAAAHRDAGSA